VRRDFHSEGVRWHSYRHPVAVEVWMSSWENDLSHVESGRRSCTPVDCARSRPSRRWSEYRSWRPLLLPVLLEGSTCPLGEVETRRGGSSAFDDAVGARVRRRDVARDVYRARGLSARLGRDRVCRSRLERLTCCQCFVGLLRWADLTIVQGVVFYPCWVPWVF
jgi:hypothetical protein